MAAAATNAGKSKKARTKRTKRDAADQAYLDPDLAPPRIKEIDKLALAYRDMRDVRQAALLEEVDLKAKLLKVMHDNELHVYRVPGQGIEVVVTNGEPEVKVKKAKDVTETVEV